MDITIHVTNMEYAAMVELAINAGFIGTDKEIVATWVKSLATETLEDDADEQEAEQYLAKLGLDLD